MLLYLPTLGAPVVGLPAGLPFCVVLWRGFLPVLTAPSLTAFSMVEGALENRDLPAGFALVLSPGFGLRGLGVEVSFQSMGAASLRGLALGAAALSHAFLGEGLAAGLGASAKPRLGLSSLLRLGLSP